MSDDIVNIEVDGEPVTGSPHRTRLDALGHVDRAERRGLQLRRRDE